MHSLYVRKVAVIDGVGDSATVDIYEEDKEGNITNLEWPDHWPSYISTRFLEQQGFEVITA